MKTFIASSVSALALATFFTVPALAADLKGDPTSAEYVAPQTPFSWTGLYIGGRLGYGNANHEFTKEKYFHDYCNEKDDVNATFDDAYNDGKRDNRLDDLVNGVLTCNAETEVVQPGMSQEVFYNDTHGLDGVNSSGITGGAQLGFDKQFGRFVIGVFGSYDLSNMNTTKRDEDGETDIVEKGDEWSVGARFGYLLHPRVLAYALAAYTQSEWTFNEDVHGGEGDKDVTFDGVTVGGGLEYAVTQNVFLGIEGTHTFYGKETIGDEYDADDNRGYRRSDEIGETKVLGTLKIKLNSDIGSSLGL